MMKVLKSGLKHIKFFIEQKILSIKSVKPEPNSPRQIKNGGKLLAYNQLINSLNQKIEKLK